MGEKIIPDGFELETPTSSVEAPTESGAVTSLKNVGRVLPAVDAVAGLLTQLYGVPLSGLAGMVTGVVTFNPELAGKVQEFVGEKLIYNPQSPGGKQLTEAAFYPLVKLREKVSEPLGDWTFEKTNSPTLSALAATAPEGLLVAAGGLHAIRSGRAGVKPPTSKINPIESAFVKDQFKKNFMKEEVASKKVVELANEDVKRFAKNVVEENGEFGIESPFGEGIYTEIRLKPGEDGSVAQFSRKITQNGVKRSRKMVPVERDGITTLEKPKWTPSTENFDTPPEYIVEGLNPKTGKWEDFNYLESLTEADKYVKNLNDAITFNKLSKGSKTKPSTAEFNKLYPEHGLKFDGMQEGIPGKPSTFQVTPQKGPLKGRTPNVDSLEPDVIKAKLDSMEPTKGKVVKLHEDMGVNEYNDNVISGLADIIREKEGVSDLSKIDFGGQEIPEGFKKAFPKDVERLKSAIDESANVFKETLKESDKPALEVIEGGKGKPTPETKFVAETGEKVPPPTDGGTTLYGGLPLQEFAKLYTKHVGAPIWDNLIMSKSARVVEKIPGGKSVLRFLDYDYRGDLPDTPTYMSSMKEMRRIQQTGREYGLDLGNRLQELPEQSQLRVGDRIRGLNVEMSEAEASLAIEARNALDTLGKQAVDVGLLDEKVFFKNVGQYLPRLYTEFEYTKNMTKWGMKSPSRLEMSRFMKRKDIPPELRKQYGEILTPGFPVAKGISQLTHDIEMAKHFNTIAANKDWSLPKTPVLNKTTGEPIPFTTKTYDSFTGKPIIKKGIKKDYASAPPKDWVKMPKNKKLGSLSEAYVHPEIAGDLNLAIKVSTAPERVWKRALGSWKFGKVILSPKTHVRNLMSNSLLSHLGGMPLWRQPTLLYKAAKEMKSRGDFWARAKAHGMLGTDFVEGELKALFDNVEANMKGISAERLPESFGRVGDAWDAAKMGMDKAAKLYQAEEQWFKMAKFIDNIERLGMDDAAASADAVKWLFDYSEVTKGQDAYRTKWYGAPFATFTFKAIPRIAEAAVKTPWRFAAPASIIYALEKTARLHIGDSEETRKAKKVLRPEWTQGNFVGIPNFPRVPIVDDSGREYYLNLSYIVPWGDLAESGDVMGVPGGVTPLSMPAIREGISQIFNYDNFWKEPIVKESDTAGLSNSEKRIVNLKKRGRHVYNTVVPTLAIDIEKGIDAMKGAPDFRGRERPAGVVAADVLAGIKMYPVDYAEQVMRKVGTLDPKSGTLGREIMNEIRVAAAKRNHHAKANNSKEATRYDKIIADKIRQLKGMSVELKKIGEEYDKTRVIKKQIPEGFERSTK